MPPSKSNEALKALAGEGRAEAAPQAPAAAPKPVKKYTKIMLYTHPKVARKIKEIAFTEERKANEVILDALDLYFATNGHTGLKHVMEN